MDDLRFGAAADVEEVRRPPSLSGHQVQRVHDQPGAVADHADPAVEPDVGQAPAAGLRLERIVLAFIRPLQVLVPEGAVVVDLQLAVGRDQSAVPGDGQGIDLHGGCVQGPGQGEELADQRRQRGVHRPQAGAEDELTQLEGERSPEGMRMEPGDRLGTGFGDLLDLHPASRAQDQDGGAGIAVHGQPQVELAGDLLGHLAPDLPDREALDLHAEDLGRDPLGVGRGAGQLDSAGLAPSADRDLSLDRHRPQGAGRQRGLVGVARQPAVRHGDTGRAKALFDLVLQELHRGMLPWRRAGPSRRLSRSSLRQRIRTDRVCCGSITSSRKPRSAAT